MCFPYFSICLWLFISLPQIDEQKQNTRTLEIHVSWFKLAEPRTTW